MPITLLLPVRGKGHTFHTCAALLTCPAFTGGALSFADHVEMGAKSAADNPIALLCSLKTLGQTPHILPGMLTCRALTGKAQSFVDHIEMGVKAAADDPTESTPSCFNDASHKAPSHNHLLCP